MLNIAQHKTLRVPSDTVSTDFVQYVDRQFELEVRVYDMNNRPRNVRLSRPLQMIKCNNYILPSTNRSTNKAKYYIQVLEHTTVHF